MKFHFWGQVPWFALSIVVNVNCPAPTVSLNGHQCLSSQEYCTDLFSAWLEAVRLYCFLLMTIMPLLSVLLPFSPVSHFQIFQTYDEMLTSLSWAVSFPGLLCWAGVPVNDLVKAWEGSKMWASWRDWTKGQTGAVFFPCTWKWMGRTQGTKSFQIKNTGM